MIGTMVAQYRIVKELGGGGMGVVYLAEDTRLGRRAALKFLPPDLTRDSAARERFELEARAASAVDHGAICTIYDIDETDDGRLYIAMAFYDGVTLDARLADAPLPLEEAVDIARQVADGLARAHERSIVHRDIKPANLMVTAHGEAKILDFGVAKLTGEAGMTKTGTPVGTLAYMAPEQANAGDVGPEVDLWALGVVLYEMIAGRSPFARGREMETLAAIMALDPEPIESLRPETPAALALLVGELLTKDPAGRPASADEVARRLGVVLDPGVHGGSAARSGVASRRRRAAAVAAGALALIALVGAGLWQWTRHRALERWAEEEAIPEVLALVGQNRMQEAAELAVRAEAVLGDHPVLAPVWPHMSTPLRIVSEPPGADVLVRAYASDSAVWTELGSTPYETDRFPVGVFRFRILAGGHEPLEVARSFIPESHLTEVASGGFDYMVDPSYVIDAKLTATGERSSEMIRVAGGPYGTTPVYGFGPVAPRVIPEYEIDRTEVTVAAYADFVATDPYGTPAAWPEPFARGGAILPFTDAMTVLVDSTGRAGPSTWLLGRPREGSDSLPVSGVSWFEAAAYCHWRGKSLPTLFHWARAALPSTDVWMPFNTAFALASNYDGAGPVTVGSRNAVGVSGAHDLGGNVREWVSTRGAGERRYLVGGGWGDPVYFLHDSQAADPWQRSAKDGFRCARYLSGEAPAELRAPIRFPVQDFSGAGVVLSDDVFEANRGFYRYDRTLPLADTIESTAELDWGARREWVSVNAVYGGERLPIRLHLPHGAQPPYEAIIVLGGGNVIRSLRMEEPRPPLDHLVRSGRVLVEPVYDGTYQRNDGRTLQRLVGGGRAELVSHWVQDLGRTLDYLTARDDIDETRVSYFGVSFGAASAPSLLPFEGRIRAAVFYSGGFGVAQGQESIDRTIGLLRRITIPVLQMGGEHDFTEPVDPYQVKFFEHLGTPPERKRLVVFDSGHQPLPLNGVMRETVDFLERHVGPEGGTP